MNLINEFSNDINCDSTNNCINNFGTTHDGVGKLSLTNIHNSPTKPNPDEPLLPMDDIIAIYRFKFTEHFMSELYQFSKIHQYDERNEFKEAWQLWAENNNDLILDETRRLINLGYEGSVLEKMYRSARYYFRKKSTEKKKPTKRCKYTGLSRVLLEKMDQHISNNRKREDYQPKTGFVDFCKENISLLKEVIQELHKNETLPMDPNIIQTKIKKTYKNRYFVLVNK